MFGKRFKLFTIFGFTVRLDLSWLVIVVLVTWTLAEGFFPQLYGDQLGAGTRWIMGAGGALGLFVAIVFHELSHSLVARRFGMPMEGITLFIFGGVAEMHNEPPTPKAEFLMAAAGPAASVIFAAVVYGLYAIGVVAGWPLSVLGVLFWLALINVVVVVFNLVPGFPLDGGRILRSALWAWKKDLRWATRVASRAGSIFGLVLIIWGIFNIISGNPIGGIWLLLIGWFIRRAADGSYQQLLLRQSLEGEPVRRFMTNDPISVPPDLSVQDLVERYIYRHHHKMFPVTQDGQLQGCVTMQQVRETPHEFWSQRRVVDIANPCGDQNTISPDEDAMEALSRMHRNKASRMMVVEQGRLIGVISLKDLLAFFSMKMDLEGDRQPPRAAGRPPKLTNEEGRWATNG